MGLIVTCGNCKASYQVGEKFAGKKAKCPQCHGELIVPLAASKAAELQEPAKLAARKTDAPAASAGALS